MQYSVNAKSAAMNEPMNQPTVRLSLCLSAGKDESAVAVRAASLKLGSSAQRAVEDKAL